MQLRRSAVPTRAKFRLFCGYPPHLAQAVRRQNIFETSFRPKAK
jgi:hypothetical protein